LRCPVLDTIDNVLSSWTTSPHVSGSIGRLLLLLDTVAIILCLSFLLVLT